MAILKNRPLFFVCLLYIICIFFAYSSSPVAKFAVCGTGALLLLCALLLLAVRRIPKKLLLPVIIGLLCVTLAFAQAYAVFDLGQKKYQNLAAAETCTLTATVTERSVSDIMTIYRVRVHDIDGNAQQFDGTLICSFVSYLQVGDRVTATVTPATYEQADSLYYNANYALADGLRMQFTCLEEQDILHTEKADFLPLIALHRLNHTLCYKILDVCGEQSGSLVCALLLGNKSFLSDTVVRDFARAGASHMLALSGMHVSILMGAVGWLLFRLRIHRKARAVILACTSVGYLLLTGVSISATRAVVMVCVLQLSYLLASDNDTLTTLGVVGAAILLLDPYSSCDAGFILSFLATFGIVVLVPPLHNYLSERTKAACKPPFVQRKKIFFGCASAVLETLLIGVIAVFSVMVPSCFLIGNMSVLSPLTTLLLSPVVAALLVLGAVVLLLSPIRPLANIVATVIRLIYALAIPYTELASGMDGVLIPLTHQAVRILSIIFCLAMVVLLILPLQKKRFLALPPLLLALSLGLFFPINAAMEKNTLQAAYTHPSSVSEAMVCTDGFRAFICDLSGGSNTAMRSAMHAAAQMHATEVGALLLTDCNPQHSAMLTDLFSAYKTDRLCMPITTDPEQQAIQAHLCEIAQSYDVEITYYQYGKPFAWGDGSTVTVHRTDLSRSEQPALVVVLEQGDACLCMLSAAAAHSTLSEKAAQAVSKADAVVCIERGPTPHLTYALDVAEGTDVVFGSDKLACYCDPHSLHGAANMILDPEIVYFTLATKQDP